ncbi:TRAP transporter small permease [Halanaerobium hydrogeniformans]|uniref:Tripartite ATP-independent periplasmic transporter DctQ component n=1 Tax=Halanaerobium hydrogeniformans TaxID=656519 RepID=E4RPX3_HALHG|nr:TRAP transporter small permease [Halanaerobium hydrogeniformans]ADQ14340.1 Tripartite ATP-independent periplasmic transporter DctQ component [Halanaerobium hydrogeniformans]
MKDNKKTGFIKSGIELSDKLLNYLAMFFLIIMVVVVSTTVFTRYVFNFTLRWTDEVALLMMIWFGFIGMALGVKESIHLSIEFFMSLLPDKFQEFIYRIEDILVGLFGWFLLRYGWQLYNATKRTRLPATKWSRGLLFIVLPISGFLIIIYSLAKMFSVIKHGTKIARVDECEGEE